MKEYHGKTVYKGIAMGPALVLHNRDQQVKRTRIDDAEAELEVENGQKQKAKEQLQKLYEKALKEVGESNAAIFEVHQMMLDDLDYLESMRISDTNRDDQCRVRSRSHRRQFFSDVCSYGR